MATKTGMPENSTPEQIEEEIERNPEKATMITDIEQQVKVMNIELESYKTEVEDRKHARGLGVGHLKCLEVGARVRSLCCDCDIMPHDANDETVIWYGSVNQNTWHYGRTGFQGVQQNNGINIKQNRRTGRVTTYNLGGNGGRATYDGMDGRYDIQAATFKTILHVVKITSDSDSLWRSVRIDLDGVDFPRQCCFAVNNPAELTQEEYDKYMLEISDIQRAPINYEQKKAAVSQVLTKAGIYHDVASLDILGKGSDTVGILSKRLKIVEKKDAGGTDASASNTGDLADITNEGSSSADDLSDDIDTSLLVIQLS